MERAGRRSWKAGGTHQSRRPTPPTPLRPHRRRKRCPPSAPPSMAQQRPGEEKIHRAHGWHWVHLILCVLLMRSLSCCVCSAVKKAWADSTAASPTPLLDPTPRYRRLISYGKLSRNILSCAKFCSPSCCEEPAILPASGCRSRMPVPRRTLMPRSSGQWRRLRPLMHHQRPRLCLP